MTRPRPFQGWFVICGLDLLPSTYLPNLKSLTPPTTKIRKAMQNVENGVVVVKVTQGHWKWHQWIQHIRVLLAFHSNYVPILYRFWDIARYWSKIAVLTYPTSIWRPRWVTPLQFRLDFWRHRVIGLSYGVVFVILRLAVLVVPACGRHTDGWTDRRTHDDNIYRANIASRGKNWAMRGLQDFKIYMQNCASGHFSL